MGHILILAGVILTVCVTIPILALALALWIVIRRQR